MRLIDNEKMQLNKKGIYEDVRRDIQRTQNATLFQKPISGGNPLEVPSMSKKRNHDANDTKFGELRKFHDHYSSTKSTTALGRPTTTIKFI